MKRKRTCANRAAADGGAAAERRFPYTHRQSFTAQKRELRRLKARAQHGGGADDDAKGARAAPVQPRNPRYMRPSTSNLSGGHREHKEPSCALTHSLNDYHTAYCDAIDTSTEAGREHFALVNCRFAQAYWPKVHQLIAALQRKWEEQHLALQASSTPTLHSYFYLKPAPRSMKECGASHLRALQRLYEEVVVNGRPGGDALLACTAPPAAAMPPSPAQRALYCRRCRRDTIVHRFKTICPRCHQEFDLVTAKDRNMKEFEQCDINRVATYKRINHFNEWVLRTQGLENRVVPANVIEAVRRRLELTSQPITADTPHKMAYGVVRAALANARFQDFFEHVPQIMRLVTPITPPRLTKEEVAEIRQIFCTIQAPFDRHKPANRRNFLSYSYIIYKIAELLEIDRILPFCPLFKSVQNQRKADLIWKKICAELDYEYIPTV